MIAASIALVLVVALSLHHVRAVAREERAADRGETERASGETTPEELHKRRIELHAAMIRPNLLCSEREFFARELEKLEKREAR